MKTCFPAMKGRVPDRRGYLLGDVLLVLLLLGILIPGLITFSSGLRQGIVRQLATFSQVYPQRQFIWINCGEDDHDE